MSTYDVIVIGAGHNGLTTAALLAKAGRKVLVVESRDVVGGLAASEEFTPGYRSGGVHTDSCLVRPSVIQSLALERHGLKVRSTAPTVMALGNEGEQIAIHGDTERAAAEIAKVSSSDGDKYIAYKAFLGRIAPVVRDAFTRPAIDIVDIESEGMWGLGKRALQVRRLGKADMMELLRLPAMCVADVLGEWFSSDLLKAALALPALAGTFTGPWSPGNAINLLRRESLLGPGIVGGGPMLIAALERAATDAGAEIRTGAAVQRIRLGADGTEGVELVGGESINAPMVAASCHPRRTFTELVAPGAIEFRLEHRINTFRSRGTVAQVLLALRTPPKLGGASDGTLEWFRTGAHVDDLERAHDALKYREVPSTPILDIHLPSVATPDLAPAGHAVASVLVHFAPHAREGGWTDAAREALGDRVVQLLGEHDADLPETIVGREVLTPLDLETRYGVVGGDLHHGEHSLDQLLVRPTPECIHYRTPLAGLYLCGSGSHPGGGLTCAPGELAARAMLAAR